MSFTMAAIAAALGAAQAGGNILAQFKTNRTNRNIAAQNNETMIELANSAHQREVSDLKAAGLNPILSAGGTGAAVPSLQQAEMKAPQFDPYITTDLIKTISEAKLNDSQANVNQKQLERIDIENLKDAATAKFTQAQTLWQEIQNDIAKGTKKTEINKKRQELDNMIAQFDEIQANIYNKQTNTAYQKLEISKYNDIQNANIDKLKSETDYNKRRASGKSKTRNYGGDLGGSFSVKGPFNTSAQGSINLGGNYGEGDTW